MSGADGYLLAVIGAMTAATFFTRAAPFLVLGRYMDHPLVRHLGRYLPPAVMLLLVVYAVRDVEPLAPPHGLYHLAAIVVTALCQLCWRNALVSIAAGTGMFMVLTRLAPLG